MRILVGSVAHESNTFCPIPTTLEDFEIVRGPDILQPTAMRSGLTGIVDTLSGPSIELVPTLAASALPSGRVTRDAYQRLEAALIEHAAGVDAVCLFLHGAMRAEGIDYGDASLLAAVRSAVGPDTPIALAMDMHANIVETEIENADAIVTYHTAPHIDRYETGQRAAEIILKMLREGIRPNMAFAKLPILLPGEMAQTSLEPMASMMRLVDEIEAEPHVLSCSLTKSHCWADVPDQGVAAIVVTDGLEPTGMAQETANRLASAFWERRAEFRFSAEAYSVDEAVRIALAAPESTVFLSDSGDNPGAGGTTDTTAVLAALLEAGSDDAVLAAIWDPEAVEACIKAGVGQVVSLAIGGKANRRDAVPVEVRGRVRVLSDGRYYHQGVRQPSHLMDMGAIAVLDVGGIDVVLSRQRISVIDPQQLRALRIEPLSYKIVALKRGYLTAPFQAISPRAILALSSGPTNCDVTHMPFLRVKRPIYPLDAETPWAPA